MQDFSPLDLGVHVRCVPALTEEEKNKIRSDPAAMYMYSLRCMERLPNDLHEAMLLAAFDPAHSSMVKHYLEWAISCDERAIRADKARKQEEFHRRSIKVMYRRSITVMYCVMLVSWSIIMFRIMF